MPINGCCKGIVADSVPPNIGTQNWNVLVPSTTLQKADGNPVTADGDDVKKWFSQNSIVMNKEVNAVNTPIYKFVSNKGYVRLNKVALSHLYATTNPLNSTFFMVYKWNSSITAGDNIPFLWYLTSETDINLFVSPCQYYAGNVYYGVSGVGNNLLYSSYTNPVNTLVVFAVSHEGTAGINKMIIDSNPIVTLNYNMTSRINTLTARAVNGLVLSGTPYSGDINLYEMRYYNTVLSDAEMLAVKAEMLALYS